MKVICVDDEPIVLKDTLYILKKIEEINDIMCFDNAADALEYLEDNAADVAFLDINMVGLDGMELARRIKQKHPRTHIVFATGYSEYTMEAFNVHASGYILKPVTEVAIREQLKYIGNSVPELTTKRFRAQTFGNFEFFADGKQLVFSCAKAKELLAYLVDRRGAAVSVGEAAAVLFDDRKNEISAKAGVRNAISELNKVFKEADAGMLINKQRSTVSLNTQAIDCDYFDMLDGSVAALNAYMGEYMAQYSWAEVTLAAIENKKK